MFETEEIWRPVNGFEGLYEVSNTNKIRSVERDIQCVRNGKTFIRRKGGKYLSPAINKTTKYAFVILVKDGVKYPMHMHRIIAFAFPEICGEYFEGAVVDHKDWDRSNNVPENLKWVPPIENHRRRKPPVFVPKISKTRPVSVENVRTGEIDYFLRREECAEFLGFAHTSQICFHLKTGKPYKRTFVIKYVEESDPKYQELRQVNSPTAAQAAYYGLN